jgi:hypothetical protein
MRNAFRASIESPEGRDHIGTVDVGVIKMDFKGPWCESVGWIHLA